VPVTIDRVQEAIAFDLLTDNLQPAQVRSEVERASLLIHQKIKSFFSASNQFFFLHPINS